MEGIYEILNTKNNRRYIGSSMDVLQRLRDHRSYLRSRKHRSQELQQDFIDYGEDTFVFRTLLLTTASLNVETQLILLAKEKGENLYNTQTYDRKGRHFDKLRRIPLTGYVIRPDGKVRRNTKIKKGPNVIKDRYKYCLKDNVAEHYFKGLKEMGEFLDVSPTYIKRARDKGKIKEIFGYEFITL